MRLLPMSTRCNFPFSPRGEKPSAWKLAIEGIFGALMETVALIGPAALFWHPISCSASHLDWSGRKKLSLYLPFWADKTNRFSFPTGKFGGWVESVSLIIVKFKFDWDKIKWSMAGHWKRSHRDDVKPGIFHSYIKNYTGVSGCES